LLGQSPWHVEAMLEPRKLFCDDKGAKYLPLPLSPFPEQLVSHKSASFCCVTKGMGLLFIGASNAPDVEHGRKSGLCVDDALWMFPQLRERTP
jgi:hypothetical protein